MWRSLLTATCVFLVVLFIVFNLRTGQQLDSKGKVATLSSGTTQKIRKLAQIASNKTWFLDYLSEGELSPDLDNEEDDDVIYLNQDAPAGQELFQPDYYLVQARVMSSRFEEGRGEFVDLRITCVYVGLPLLKGRIFLAVQHTGGTNLIGKIGDRDNPPLDKGELGIWWVRKTGRNDGLEAVFDSLQLMRVGGWWPARKGILQKKYCDANGNSCYYAQNYKSHEDFCSDYPSYKDALEYAAVWQKMYNTTDIQNQMGIIMQVAGSSNRLISNGVAELLVARKPERFSERFYKDCFTKLAANPKLYPGFLREAKDYLNHH